ncbi:MAG: transposase [Deltaproteobacteria bacterium]|nr:transposase [Nannocystaceae bacterium]
MASSPAQSVSRKRLRPVARPRQLDLPARTHGGARKGSGRKRTTGRARVPHRKRPELDRNHPLHVTIRIVAGVPRLRARDSMRTIVQVLRSARGRFGVHVVQFALMEDHLHLLVESEGTRSLGRGMRGLGTRLAIHLNRVLGRKGKLLEDRYHARPLTSPLEVRRGLAYVLNNYRKHAAAHGRWIAAHWVDPYSSARCFDGWRIPPVEAVRRSFDLGTSRPRTWLLCAGWRRHGLLDTAEVPGRVARRRRQPDAANEREAA